MSTATENFLHNAPGLLFTLRVDADGRLSMPFAGGALACQGGVEALLARCQPGEAERLLLQLTAARDTLAPVRLDLRFRDGRLMRFSASAQRDGADGAVLWHGFLHQAAAPAPDSGAEESASRACRIVESSPNHVICYDRDGRIRLINRRLRDFMGVSGCDGILGKLPSEVWPDGRYDVLQRAAAQAVATGKQVVIEIAATNAEGAAAIHEIQVVPDRDANGAIVGSIVFGRDITEHKRMEEELRRREAYLRTLIDAFPFFFWLKDQDCRLLAANKEYARVARVATTAELEGKTDFDFFPRDLAEKYVTDDRAVMAARAPKHDEEPYADEHGDRHWMETWKSPLIVDGRVVGTVGFSRDITERKQMEEELRRREQYQRTLIDNFPFFFWLKDENSRYLAANREFARMAQLKTAIEFEGKTDFDLFPPEMASAYVADDREVIATRASKQIEELCTGENGEVRWVETWKSPILDDGRVVGTVGYSRDITARKQVDEKLQQALQFSEGILNAIPDLLFEVDGDGRYLHVRAPRIEHLAAPAEQLLGRTVSEVLWPESAAIVMDCLHEAVDTGLSQGKVIEIVLADGPHWFELSASRMKAGIGAEARLLVISRDVTERKRMELALAMREREFRTLVENATDTVGRFARDLRCLYANPAFTAKWGMEGKALVGHLPEDAFAGDVAAAFEDHLGEVFDSGRDVEFELRSVNRVGEEFCCLINLTPEFGADGQVDSVLSVGRDITELHVFRQKIHQIAFYDPLTGLPNRALLDDRLGQMIADAARHAQTAGVMMVDIDRFKAINDTMGHAVGDDLLREAARRLKACVRASDTVARLGGDEFVILLPEVRCADDPGRIASNILAQFNERFMLDGREVFVSCSIGISLYPADSTDAGNLLKFADSAMYSAKRGGRNGFRFYSSDMTVHARERLAMESELRRAVERNELELHYQPKVALDSGEVVGSEALLRWHNPRLGMVSPVKFIPVAEDTGIILEIGTWVLRQACRAAAEWNGAGRPRHKVAINLSARQFQSRSYDLVGTVAEVLHESGCRPQWIELEITESLLLDEHGETLEKLLALRAMGISIAIDDFGTGYSALSYLARFPIDTLKIDRSFINGVCVDDYSGELVKAILSIARSLNQEVVAEGVETVEQAAFLNANGCQNVQGYLYSRPLPKAEFEKLGRRFGHGEAMILTV